MSQEFETAVSGNFPFHGGMENSPHGQAKNSRPVRAEKNSDANVRPFDFTNPDRHSSQDLKRLRKQQETFAAKMASRFSGQLQMECSLRIETIEVVPGRSLASHWPEAGHLALFKIEPLRGVALLEFGAQLASGMIERLLGGRGTGSAEPMPFSEVEVILFEQITRLFAAEWCANWASAAGLKPVLLGYEANSRFRQIASPQGRMLAITFELTAGLCSGQIRFGLLFDSFEPLIKKLAADSIHKSATATATKISRDQNPVSDWQQSFGEVPVAVTAEWPATELSAREVLALKVGDVLRMDVDCTQGVQVRLADELKFQGRPGTLAGQWAVELTRLIV